MGKAGAIWLTKSQGGYSKVHSMLKSHTALTKTHTTHSHVKTNTLTCLWVAVSAGMRSVGFGASWNTRSRSLECSGEPGWRERETEQGG